MALLSDCYPPRTGGIESQVGDLAAQLVTAGHEVEVFTATAGGAGERGTRVDRLDAGGDARIARVAVDLLGPVPLGELRTRARVVRPGRRIQLLESELVAGGRTVARASAWPSSPPRPRPMRCCSSV